MKKYYLPIMGGLGNQFFQFAAALDAAAGEVLVIDCTLLNPRLNRNGFPEILSFDLPSTVELYTKKTNKILRKLLNLSLRISLKQPGNPFSPVVIIQKLFMVIMKCLISVSCVIRYRSFTKVVIPGNVGWYPEVNLKPGSYMYGYFQSYRWFQKEMTLKKLRNLKVKDDGDKLEKYRVKAHSEKPIILHIRRGDYRFEPGIGLLDFEYYKGALEHVRLNYVSRKVWVFSDEVPAAKKLLEKVEDFDFEYIQQYSDDSALTFEIMRMGDIYIIANSSFSYWAATLSRNEKPVVICPEPWFRTELSPSDITPSDWIKIKV